MSCSKSSNANPVLAVIGLSLLAVHATAIAASPAWLTANDAEIKALVATMPLAEKAGQMTQPDIGSIKDLSDIKTLFPGSVLSGGTSDPFPRSR